MKLIPMIDFVLENQDKVLNSELGLLAYRYANFLKQPLKLEMFVPCVNGKPFNYSKHGNREQYEQAKEKVLFEGFNFENNKLLCRNTYVGLDVNEYSNIEELQNDDCYEIILNESAIKQIGL